MLIHTVQSDDQSAIRFKQVAVSFEDTGELILQNNSGWTEGVTAVTIAVTPAVKSFPTKKKFDDHDMQQ